MIAIKRPLPRDLNFTMDLRPFTYVDLIQHIPLLDVVSDTFFGNFWEEN